MTDDNTGVSISRRQTLATLGTVGAAGALGGAATNALLWDEEKFGNAEAPNVLQAGELDLKVDWEGTYYNWKENPTFSSDGEVDQPGPIINLQDVKPGDVLETTLSAHVYDNPAFLGWHYQEHADTDNGITEPEDKVNGHTPDESDGDPFAAGIFGLGLLGAPAMSSLVGKGKATDGAAHDENDSSDAGLRRKTLRTAGAASAAVGGLGLASGVASASSTSDPKADGEVLTDSDGNQDVAIANDELAVDVGELDSDGWEWDPSAGGDPANDGFSTLFNETYAFQDGNGSVQAAGSGFYLNSEATVVDPFPSTVSPGTTATATVEFANFETDDGSTTTLTVDRNVTLDPNEATLRVEYDIQNTGGTDIDDLSFYQFVDYDIGDRTDDWGQYFFDAESECEYIFQKSFEDGVYCGFTADRLSANHELSHYDPTEQAVENGSLNNKDSHPDQNFGTDDCGSSEDNSCAIVTDDGQDFEVDDVGLAFEWSLGSLPAGESTTFRNSFVYNTQEEEFQQEICQESPGGEPPAEDDGELDDVMNCVIWHDDGDNLPEEIWTGDTAVDGDDDGELDSDLESYVMEIANAQSPEDVVDTQSDQVIFAGTLAELDQNISRVMLDANDAVAGTVAEQFPDSTCYQNSVTEYIGVLCWVPEDIPGVNDNVIQTDRLEFQFGFDAIQCRHNVSSDGTPIDGNITQADADNNANTP